MVTCIYLVLLSLLSINKLTISYNLLKIYNEDLIHVFYLGLHEKQGSCFSFSIGNKVYQFTNYFWKTFFLITMGDPNPDDKVESSVTDLYTHVNFD